MSCMSDLVLIWWWWLNTSGWVSLSFPRLALLPGDYLSCFSLGPTSFLFLSYVFIYIGEVFSSSGACMGETSRRRRHLRGWVSPPGGNRALARLCTFHASFPSSETGRRDVLSNPAQPTSLPADWQAVGGLRQVSPHSLLSPPGRSPRAGQSSSYVPA